MLTCVEWQKWLTTELNNCYTQNCLITEPAYLILFVWFQALSNHVLLTSRSNAPLTSKIMHNVSGLGPTVTRKQRLPESIIHQFLPLLSWGSATSTHEASLPRQSAIYDDLNHWNSLHPFGSEGQRSTKRGLTLEGNQLLLKSETAASTAASMTGRLSQKYIFSLSYRVKTLYKTSYHTAYYLLSTKNPNSGFIKLLN